MNKTLSLFKSYGARLIAPLADKSIPLGVAPTIGALFAAYMLYKGHSTQFLLASSVTTGLYLNKLARNARSWENEIFRLHGEISNIRKHVHRIKAGGDILITLTGGVATFFVQRRDPNSELVWLTAGITLVMGAITHRDVKQNGGWRQLLKPTL